MIRINMELILPTCHFSISSVHSHGENSWNLQKQSIWRRWNAGQRVERSHQDPSQEDGLEWVLFLSIPRLLNSIFSHSRYHLLSSKLPRESHRFATVHSPKIRHHMVEGPRFLHCKPRPLCSGTDHLLTSSPHALVPRCEFDLFENDLNSINLDGLASPRIFATHAPYNYDSAVKIEYKRRA